MSINRTIRILGVAKSSIYYQPKSYPERKKSIRKNLADTVTTAIKEITAMKSTYGTPRCEALNGTFKRDYVFENCLENPQVVMDQIQKWVDEYNTYAPHSSLNMKTPKEFYTLKTAA